MCGAVEEPLTAADRSLGGVTQGLARCVEAESLKKCGLASKASAPRQKVRPRALTDQPENGKVPRKASTPSRPRHAQPRPQHLHPQMRRVWAFLSGLGWQPGADVSEPRASRSRYWKRTRECPCSAHPCVLGTGRNRTRGGQCLWGLLACPFAGVGESRKELR